MRQNLAEQRDEEIQLLKIVSTTDNNAELSDGTIEAPKAVISAQQAFLCSLAAVYLLAANLKQRQGKPR